MPSAPTQPLSSPGGTRIRPAAAAVTAGLVSLFLHAWLIRDCPPLPLGRIPDRPPAPRFHPVALGQVRPRPDPVPADRSALVPRAPGAPELPDPARRMIEEIARSLADRPPELAVVPPAGSDRPTAAVETPGAREVWSARQEILEIEDRRVRDADAAIPRRIEPAAVRGPGAPDLAPPEAAPLAARELAALGAGGPRPSVADAVTALALPVPVPGLGSDFSPLPPDGWLPDADLTDPAAPDGVEDLLAFTVRAFAPADEPGWVYYRIHIERAGIEALPVMGRNVLFIQDASLSMGQAKLDRAKEGLRQALATLGPQDRFEIMVFREDVQRCFGAWAAPTAANLARARWFVDTMPLRGSTDVLASLEALAAMPRDPHRATVAIMVSDGIPTVGMVDSSEIIGAFSRANQGRVSVFTAGGGPRVNHFLLDFLSFKNRGDTLVVPEVARLGQALLSWNQALRRPVLTDLRFRLSNLADEDVFPRQLPHLFLDRPLVLYGRARVGEAGAIRIAGRSGGEEKDIVFAFAPGEAAPGGPALRVAWARQKLYDLLARHLEDPRPERLAEARAFADRHGLQIPYPDDLPGLRGP